MNTFVKKAIEVRLLDVDSNLARAEYDKITYEFKLNIANEQLQNLILEKTSLEEELKGDLV